MSDTVKAQKNLFDAITDALGICDWEDIAPIDGVAPVFVVGAHGLSATQGLIITTTDGKRYQISATEIAA